MKSLDEKMFTWFVNLTGMSQMFSKLGECVSYSQKEQWMMIHFSEDLKAYLFNEHNAVITFKAVSLPSHFLRVDNSNKCP